MTRQAIVRILLSLLLLASQQMASLHVLAHLSGAGSGAVSVQDLSRDPVSRDTLSSALALDESCSHCLAFAQLAGPLGSTPPAFVLPDAGTTTLAVASANPASARTVLAFHSRAPPQA